jgi:ABC-type phosphate transport system substrate-binding protein
VFAGWGGARLALAGVLLGGTEAPAETAAPAVAIKVVVHPGVPGKSIRKGQLTEIFLRRADKWGDGTPIKPVDQISNSPARIAFNRGVLGVSTLDVQQYWVSQISKGRTPPPVMKTEEQVVVFVAANPGAIGYVSESASIPGTVRVLQIE